MILNGHIPTKIDLLFLLVFSSDCLTYIITYNYQYSMNKGVLYLLIKMENTKPTSNNSNECCEHCAYLAKLISFGDKDNYQWVCTLFNDKSMSNKPYVCFTKLTSSCEMFTEKPNNEILSEQDIFGSEELTINGMDALTFDKHLDLLNDNYIEEQENKYYDLLSTLEGNNNNFWII